ncbi:zinc ribbon domain-containing protein [Streptomyces sp. NPDC055100]|uniref:zinc ribbon domain-containing protein n=1 Tax=Streptomyces sp. NPDC127532 TaxID=3345399 RepID=UPI003639833C
MAVLQQGILGLRPAKHTPDPRRQAVHCTSCGLSMDRDLNAARNIAEHSVAVPVPPVAPGRRRRETPVESPSDSRPLGGGNRGQRNGKTPGHRARCHSAERSDDVSPSTPRTGNTVPESPGLCLLAWLGRPWSVSASGACSCRSFGGLVRVGSMWR